MWQNGGGGGRQGRGGSPGDGNPFRIPEGETLTTELWDRGGGRELGELRNENKKEGERQKCLERHSLTLQITDCIWIRAGCRINFESCHIFLKNCFWKIKIVEEHDKCPFSQN